MIQSLHRSLATRAQSAATHRVERVALDFFDRGNSLSNLVPIPLDFALGFHQPHKGPASRAALTANAGMPFFLARDDLMLGYQQRDDFSSLLAACAGQQAA